MKKENYYVILFEAFEKNFWIIKSENYKFIENKIRSIVNYYNSHCYINPKDNIDNSSNIYQWCFVTSFCVCNYRHNKKYLVYAHKTKQNQLPRFSITGHFAFTSPDPIRDATDIIEIKKDENYNPYESGKLVKEFELLKKCLIKLIPIKDQNLVTIA